MKEVGCLVEAAHWSHEGFAVISCTGNIYMPEDLGVKYVPGHYASVHTHGMTIDERRGPWTKGERA